MNATSCHTHFGQLSGEYLLVVSTAAAGLHPHNLGVSIYMYEYMLLQINFNYKNVNFYELFLLIVLKAVNIAFKKM